MPVCPSLINIFIAINSITFPNLTQDNILILCFLFPTSLVWKMLSSCTNLFVVSLNDKLSVFLLHKLGLPK